MKIDFRPAQPGDLRFVLPLIYSSGPHEFDYIFNVGNKTTLDYLALAFPTRSGTQSHRVYTVAEGKDRIVGICAFYTGQDMPRLSLGNFWNVLRFYGLQHVTKIARQADDIETIIPPLEVNAGFINQLGVDEEFRSQGIGTALVQHQIQFARRRGLRKCVLDVAVTNPRAQALYERLGFKVVQENRWNFADSKIHVPGQRRMELPL